MRPKRSGGRDASERSERAKLFSGNLALVTRLDPRGEFVVRDLHLRQKASELHDAFRVLKLHSSGESHWNSLTNTNHEKLNEIHNEKNMHAFYRSTAYLRQKASELHNTFRALLAGTRQVGVLDSVEPLPTFDKTKRLLRITRRQTG